MTARHALGFTILTWVSSADVKAKLEILLGVCFDHQFRKKCLVLGSRFKPIQDGGFRVPVVLWRRGAEIRHTMMATADATDGDAGDAAGDGAGARAARARAATVAAARVWSRGDDDGDAW